MNKTLKFLFLCIILNFIGLNISLAQETKNIIFLKCLNKDEMLRNGAQNEELIIDTEKGIFFTRHYELKLQKNNKSYFAIKDTKRIQRSFVLNRISLDLRVEIHSKDENGNFTGEWSYGNYKCEIAKRI